MPSLRNLITIIIHSNITIELIFIKKLQLETMYKFLELKENAICASKGASTNPNHIRRIIETTYEETLECIVCSEIMMLRIS